jgi:hypothetical protein
MEIWLSEAGLPSGRSSTPSHAAAIRGNSKSTAIINERMNVPFAKCKM